MKILMLAEYFYPFDRGGSEWSIFHLASQLVKLKHRVIVFTPNYGTRFEEKYNHINIVRFPFYKKLTRTYASITPYHQTNIIWFILSLYFLGRLVIKSKPEVIHIQGKYFLPAGIIIGKLFGIKTIITLRDYIILCPYALCIYKNRSYRRCGFAGLFKHDIPKYEKRYIISKKLQTKIFLWLSAIRGYLISRFLQFCLQLTDKRIAISKKLADVYTINGFRIDQVIYNPMIFKNTKFRKTENKIMFIGRLTPGKGINRLITAYKNLSQKNGFPKLHIIGEGPVKAQLQMQKIQGITYKGQIHYEDTLKALAESRFLVVPSVWEEPFGRVALEALSLGIPVLAADRGGLPEIIKNNFSGLIVSPTVHGLTLGLQKMIKNTGKFRNNIRLNMNYYKNKFMYRPAHQYLDIYKKL